MAKKSSEVVGISISRFHGSENDFEMLLAYSDGREVGKLISRKVLEALREELAREA